MIYDLIEVKPKLNKKKVIIVSIITIVVIVIGVLLGIKFAIVNNTGSDNNQTILAKGEDASAKTKHIPTITMLPNYTDIGRQLFSNLYHQEGKNVYLTFDDGPSTSVTPLILDVLKQENVKATFFVLGSRAERFPEIIQREFNEGHYIANHGYSHSYGNIYASIDAVLEEYNTTKQVISKILNNGYDGHLFRFPGGATGGKYSELKKEAKNLLDQNGIASIDWNALSQDAAGAKTKEALLENVITSVGQKQNVVILMHDAGDKILTYEVLPEVISYLKQQGYTFKTFYDIMK